MLQITSHTPHACRHRVKTHKSLVTAIVVVTRVVYSRKNMSLLDRLNCIVLLTNTCYASCTEAIQPDQESYRKKIELPSQLKPGSEHCSLPATIDENLVYLSQVIAVGGVPNHTVEWIRNLWNELGNCVIKYFQTSQNYINWWSIYAVICGWHIHVHCQNKTAKLINLASIYIPLMFRMGFIFD